MNTTHASYVSGLTTTFIGGWTLNEVAIVVGIVCTVGTFAVNFYFKLREARFRESHIETDG